MTDIQAEPQSLVAQVEQILALHHAGLRGCLDALERLTTEAADANAAVAPELLELPELAGNFIACVSADLNRQEQVLLPMIARLQEQTVVSGCHAGMIRSRVTLAEREQARAQGVLVRIRTLAHRYLSPSGPCEACHELLAHLEAIEQAMTRAHAASRQLFADAVKREAALTQH